MSKSLHYTRLFLTRQNSLAAPRDPGGEPVTARSQRDSSCLDAVSKDVRKIAAE